MKSLYFKISPLLFATFLLVLFTLCGMYLRLFVLPVFFVRRPTGVRLLNALIRFWGTTLFRCGMLINRVRLEQSGFEPTPGRPYLIVSNHQSIIDIVTLFWVFRNSHIKFVMKKELQWGIPNISPAARYARFAFLNRKASLTAAEEVLAPFCRAAREEGAGVVIFPEGTRGRDGNLRRFKPAGAFFLAQQLDYEVLIVTLDGTWRAATPWDIYRNLPGMTIKVHLEEPQAVASFRADPKASIEMVRQGMEERLAEFRGRRVSTQEPADRHAQAGGQ